MNAISEVSVKMHIQSSIIPILYLKTRSELNFWSEDSSWRNIAVFEHTEMFLLYDSTILIHSNKKINLILVFITVF